MKQDNEMTMEPMTIMLPPGLKADLEAVAAASGNTAQTVVVDALAQRIAAHHDLRAKLAIAEADVAAGRLVPHEQVMAEMEALIAHARNKA
jgi:predicted transcriptional regulator